MTLTDYAEQPSLFADLPPLPPAIEAPCPCCRGRGVILLEGAIPSAPARPTDPETSHSAGPREPDIRRFSAESRQARLLEAIAREPMTAQAAALLVIGSASVSRIEGCRRRISDLYRAGMIEDSGERAFNADSIDPSVVWQVSAYGRATIERLGETGWST